MKKKDEKKEKTKNRARRVHKPVGACYFTQTGTTPDYKDVLTLKRFTSDRGKIIPQKYTGVSAKNQRLLSVEIKKARYMALLPYTDKHLI